MLNVGFIIIADRDGDAEEICSGNSSIAYIFDLMHAMDNEHPDDAPHSAWQYGANGFVQVREKCMSDYKQDYRLPDGTTTKDPDHFAAVWEELANEVLKKFSGYSYGGVSGHYRLIIEFLEFRQDGKYTCTDSIKLSPRACRSLLYGETPKRVTREDI